MAADRNNGPATVGRAAAGRFAAGNPGRPKGARHKATLAAERMLDGEARRITRAAIDLAIAKDPAALRLCMERIVPPRKERPITFALPPIATVADHPAALAAALSALACGELTAPEAQCIAALLGEHRKALELADVDARITALEQRINR